MKQIQDTDRVFGQVLALPVVQRTLAVGEEDQRAWSPSGCGARPRRRARGTMRLYPPATRHALACAAAWDGGWRACFLMTSSITSSAVRTNGSIVYTAPTAAIFFLLTFSPLPRRWFAEAGSGASVASSGGKAERTRGTPLQSAVTTKIGPSSVAFGHRKTVSGTAPRRRPAPG